jgi:cell division protein FtsA
MKFRNKPFHRHHTSTVAGLDIGASKVCCAVAHISSGNKLNLLGIGYHASKGLRAGAIVDMEALEVSVAHAVHSAEEMANETIQEVFLSVSAPLLTSKTITTEITVNGHPIDETDVRRVLNQGNHHLSHPPLTSIHTIPLGYHVDQAEYIQDPRGMFGDILGGSIHGILAPQGALRNLVACVERCHLDVAGFVASPYSASLSSLVDDERDLGVTLVDMGAGSTSIALFSEGKLCSVDYVPVGGAHVTNDIARGLSTPLLHAERIKTLYGSAMMSPTDAREAIIVPQMGEDDLGRGAQVTKAELVRIIRPRIEEIFELIREKLHHNPMAPLCGRRLVLTGGSSQLAGVRELASVILEKQSRLGRPFSMDGLDDKRRVPSFSTCAGLLAYGLMEQQGISTSKNHLKNKGVFNRMNSWLKKHVG